MSTARKRLTAAVGAVAVAAGIFAATPFASAATDSPSSASTLQTIREDTATSTPDFRDVMKRATEEARKLHPESTLIWTFGNNKDLNSGNERLMADVKEISGWNFIYRYAQGEGVWVESDASGNLQPAFECPVKNDPAPYTVLDPNIKLSVQDAQAALRAAGYTEKFLFVNVEKLVSEDQNYYVFGLSASADHSNITYIRVGAQDGKVIQM